MSGCSERGYRGRVANVDRTGLQAVRRELAYSKKDLLLFRKVHVMGLERQLREMNHDSQLLAECEFLLESEFLVDAPEPVAEMGCVRLGLLGLSGRGGRVPPVSVSARVA